MLDYCYLLLLFFLYSHGMQEVVCKIALLKFISINIIAAISWPPPLISQLFSPRLFKVAPFFHSLAVFVWISLLFVLYKAPKPAYD